VEPIELFVRAAGGAVGMVARVAPGQWGQPTPCADWDVEALVAHMAGGPRYLLGALGVEDPDQPEGYRAAVRRCAVELVVDGALERRCPSPAGFEWSVADACAGTAMDQLVHTWDLAVAIGADRALDGEAVDAVVARFLPEMPEIGRAAGIVGAAVAVPADATAQVRLLGAMGRTP
jgi:uncharacterized protein (TIGR03086 family)